MGVKINIKWLRIAAWLLDGCWKPLEWLLERSWRRPEPKKSVLEASWSRLGALKIASRCPDTDRPEVEGRLTEHLWLALAPGERHLSKVID